MTHLFGDSDAKKARKLAVRMAQTVVFDLCLNSTKLPVFSNQDGGLTASFDQVKAGIYLHVCEIKRQRINP
jgi:hypothetical protein